MSHNYERKTDRLHRSFDFVELAGTGNPYRLLASAIVFQCAVDCDAIKDMEWGSMEMHRFAKGAMTELTMPNMLDFINGDWLDFLLSWSDISTDAVRENLLERLGVNEQSICGNCKQGN